MTRMMGDVDVLNTRELPAFCDDVVDMEGLRECPVSWVLATGVDSAGLPYDRPVRALADRVGIDCVSFPVGHTVYREEPSAFVEGLEHCREQD